MHPPSNSQSGSTQPCCPSYPGPWQSMQSASPGTARPQVRPGHRFLHRPSGPLPARGALADVVEAHFNHGVGVDVFGVRVDVVEEVARWVSRGVIRLEQRVEQPCLCLDWTVVCRAVGDPLDETGLVSMLLQSRERCTHALGFLGADPSAGLS